MSALTGAIVLSNLAYLIAAVVVIVIASLIVTLRHRKPKSVEANMESFNRGLQALSPDAAPRRRARHRSGFDPGVPRPRSVQTVTPQRPAGARRADEGREAGAG